MPGNIRSINYKDSLAVRKRRSLILKIFIWSLITLAIIAALGYLVFFSRLFEIKNISVNGLETIDKDLVFSDIKNQTSGKTLGLDFKNNILFQDGSKIAENFLKEFPVLKSVESSRQWMHGLIFNFSERKPLGIWCFAGETPASNEGGASCQYFDETMKTWGTAPKTTGFIFLTVEDMRKSEGGAKIDPDFFNAIRTIAGEKINNLTVKNIVIPEDSAGDFKVFTDKNFYILFSLDSNLQNQLRVLKTFWEQKMAEPDFSPQYLDLRVDGRVYYK